VNSNLLKEVYRKGKPVAQQQTNESQQNIPPWLKARQKNQKPNPAMEARKSVASKRLAQLRGMNPKGK
jgi:hypothetical protein